MCILYDILIGTRKENHHGTTACSDAADIIGER